MSMRAHLLLLLGGLITWPAYGQTMSHNFDLVTGLARGAVQGDRVTTPVPGFELLLMHEGEVVYNQAFGDWQVGRGVGADSATKTLSAAVVMSLVDSSPRPFSLDTRLSEYIPQFNGEKQSITVRQAFSHMHGLAESEAISRRDISLHESALEIAAAPSWTPPGFAFIYGGTGMQAAGAVAEIAGGADWRRLFQERIAEPLELTQTQYVASGPENPRIGGGVRTTATEYARLMEMLRNGGAYQGKQVLSKGAVDEMLTRQTPNDLQYVASPLDGSSDHGVGIWLDQRDARGNLTGALAGGLRGFTSWIDFDDGMVGVLATDVSSFENLQDLQYLIRAAAEEAIRTPTLAGDANLDGKLSLGDALTVVLHYGKSDRTWAEGDFNGDGTVDHRDLAILAENFQSLQANEAPVAAGAWMVAVPEPSAWLLAASALFGLFWYARRAPR